MNNRKLIKEIIINFLVWVVGLFLIIFTITWIEYQDQPDARYYIKYTTIALMCLVLAASSVSHYYLLYLRYFQKGQYAKYVWGILIILIVTIVLDNAIVLAQFKDVKGLRMGIMDGLHSTIMRNVFFYTPAALFYTLIKANVALRKRRKQLEQQQLESSIAALKSQLDPHFLFNTLNTLYATAQQEQAVKTATSIEELAGLFRYAIQEAGAATVSVEKELAFIDKYLQLQQLRLPQHDHIQIKTHIYWDKMPASIAPMLLLPFIENAFKYGISYKEPSVVDIHIDITNGKLEMKITNTDYYTSGTELSNGIGLTNVTKRLELQYANKYQLEHKRENGRYHVSLTIAL